MIRRLALAVAGAVLATAGLASCATFSDNDAAARVGDIELGRDEIDDLLDLGATPGTDPADGGDEADLPLFVSGASVRDALSRWIRVALLERYVGAKPASEIASTADLATRLDEGLDALTAKDPEAGRLAYDQGVPTSPAICLGAIPVETSEEAERVRGEIAGGLPFAEAAAQYSIDPTLAGNGGVVVGGDGSECFATSGLNPPIVEALSGTTPGTPVAIDIEGIVAVIQQRPWDQLSEEGRALVQELVVAEQVLPDVVGSGDVHVDSYYGYWDPATASVLPFRG